VTGADAPSEDASPAGASVPPAGDSASADTPSVEAARSGSSVDGGPDVGAGPGGDDRAGGSTTPGDTWATEFDTDTAVIPTGEAGHYRGTVTPRWDVIGGAPNGGYLVGLLLRAVAAEIAAPDPLTMTAHFLDRVDHGPATIEVEPQRTGRRHDTARARLLQDGTPRILLTATFGHLDHAVGPTRLDDPRFEVPVFDDCLPTPPGVELPEILHRFEMRHDPTCVGWAMGEPSGVGWMAGWLRFTDGRRFDPFSVPVAADAFAPAVLNLLDEVVWVPTLELTVHVRTRPRGQWLQAGFRTRYVLDGYLEEDGEVRDDDGRLVAISRQLALIRRA
jgi:hypothetical protein